MKKRIVSMLLALTLVVTGMPVGITAEGVNAVEISESETFVETEETKVVIENNDSYQIELRPEAGDFHTFNVSSDGKAVGSDGVVYEDVAYLSVNTVKSFGAEGQSAYVEICDRIAEEKNAGGYLEDAVIAVDEKGNLMFQRKIPMKVFYASMEELAEGFFEDTSAIQEDQVEDDDIFANQEEIEELSVEEIVVESDTEEESLQNEDPDDGNVDEEIDIEEAVEESLKLETSMEDDSEEQEPSTEDTTATEGVLTEENSVDEAVENKEEDLTEEETETAIEEFALTAENMELIYEPEVEEFEIVENAKADIILDLGYGSAGDMQQFRSILPVNDWFSKQLTSSQKAIYDVCKVMGKGTNTFTLTKQYSNPDIYQAVSAYIMTEPYKCDWMDLTKGAELTDWFVKDTGAFVKTTMTLAKSKYYTAAIQKEANAKVLELAAQAQEYAGQNYPTSPVYGIVKYFDKWICENSYYNYDGVYGSKSTLKEVQEAYYYCHSSYGILLKGYGVCESYALAMTRLLDAIGIPNMYATGLAVTASGSGGHAWNYVEMPDEKWYLQDSTWNDVDIDTPDKVNSPSTEGYLLCEDDTAHIPQGIRWMGLKAFSFIIRSSSSYIPVAEEITLSKSEINLLPKKTEELTYISNPYIANENVPKVWESSNEKVAKVDKNGKVTAVAPGSAEITLTAAGMAATCKVNVHEIKSITFEEGGKASLTTSCGIVSSTNTKITQKISLIVNQKAEKPVYTAEQLNDKDVFDDFEVKSLDENVVKVSAITLKDNKIDFAITPEKAGKTKINVTFGTKKATLTVSVGEMLDENWFKLEEVKELVNTGVMYDGKAHKPKVILSDAGKNAKVKFKVSYGTNKDAGKASVIIVGNGTYGGKLDYYFDIKPLVLDVDTASIKVTDKPVLYNGGANLTKSTVKHKMKVEGKPDKLVGLKAGKDYDIVYTNKDTKESTTEPSKVGTYTMEKIVGKGNYTGEANVPEPIKGKPWTIEPNDIKKVKVTVKVNGTTPVVTAAIGKNILIEKTAGNSNGDYTIKYYKDKDCKEPYESSVFASKHQYYVQVVPEGSNITIGPKSKPIVKSFKTK